MHLPPFWWCVCDHTKKMEEEVKQRAESSFQEAKKKAEDYFGHLRQSYDYKREDQVKRWKEMSPVEMPSFPPLNYEEWKLPRDWEKFGFKMVWEHLYQVMGATEEGDYSDYVEYRMKAQDTMIREFENVVIGNNETWSFLFELLGEQFIDNVVHFRDFSYVPCLEHTLEWRTYTHTNLGNDYSFRFGDAIQNAHSKLNQMNNRAPFLISFGFEPKRDMSCKTIGIHEGSKIAFVNRAKVKEALRLAPLNPLDLSKYLEIFVLDHYIASLL